MLSLAHLIRPPHIVSPEGGKFFCSPPENQKTGSWMTLWLSAYHIATAYSISGVLPLLYVSFL